MIEYFLDNSDNVNPLGNSYVTIDFLDNYFGSFPTGACSWGNFTDAMKTSAAIAATQLIDGKDPKGELVDDNQPLQFPTRIDLVYYYTNRQANYYSIATQKRLLALACAVQIEQTLFKGSLAQVTLSQDGESVTDRFFSLSSLAVGKLQRFYA